ncbi:MAG: 50S ribosomal protein L22 [Candidatus Parcubacteria bacterium]|nr:MAG: 50S ribosomal protein L22 [Candidatus Parcubacteria bacterium]
MPEAIAKLNYFRMSPRKVRMVAKIIKGLPVNYAERQLMFYNKKAAKALLKLLKSAIANAKNKGYDSKDLYVEKIVVNEGPHLLKRFYPKARGRVGRILKRMSHIEICLGKIENMPLRKKEQKNKQDSQKLITQTS